MDYETFFAGVFCGPRADLPRHLSFRDYQNICMFDPQVGYYGGGRVRFGVFQDYWTFPGRMGPAFGEMLAERVLELWRVVGEEVEGGDDPFHLVEVGGGQGELLRDLLDAIKGRARRDETAAALDDRLRAVSVDRSPALLAKQREAQAGHRVTYVNASATELARVLPQPFFGLVFANELLDQIAVELVRVGAERCERLRVLPWCRAPLDDLGAEGDWIWPAGVGPEFRPLGAEALPELIGRLRRDETLLRAFAKGEVVRWTALLEPVDAEETPELAAYLDRSDPARRHLAALGELPVWLPFAPGLVTIFDQIAELLNSGAGAFLAIEYGGTASYTFDPHSRYPKLRSYCRSLDGDGETRRDVYRHKLHNPVRVPGAEDVSADVDFTWACSYLESKGLELGHYGHQSALEKGLDLWSNPIKGALVRGRLAEGYSGADAIVQAYDLVKRFRASGGFYVFIVTSAGRSHTFAALGRSDPLRYDELAALPAQADRDALRARLAERLAAQGVAEQAATEVAAACIAALHPTGAVVDDLSDQNLYRWRWDVLEVVREALERAAASP